MPVAWERSSLRQDMLSQTVDISSMGFTGGVREEVVEYMMNFIVEQKDQLFEKFIAADRDKLGTLLSCSKWSEVREWSKSHMCWYLKRHKRSQNPHTTPHPNAHSSSMSRHTDGDSDSDNESTGMSLRSHPEGTRRTERDRDRV